MYINQLKKWAAPDSKHCIGTQPTRTIIPVLPEYYTQTLTTHSAQEINVLSSPTSSLNVKVKETLLI